MEKLIFITYDKAEADIVKGKLESSGMAVLVNGPFKVFAEGLAPIRIYVSEENVKDAMKLLNIKDLPGK